MNPSDDYLDVTVMMPAVHFYAPRVVLGLDDEFEDVRFRFVLTPKFSRADGSGWSVADVARQQGLRYLTSMAVLRVLYGMGTRFERWREVGAKDRQFPDPTDVARYMSGNVAQVTSVQEQETIRSLTDDPPDLLLSVFFNQIIPDQIIDSAKHAFNLHPGPLPGYRGYSPVFWQLYHGENEAGITLHELTDQLDAGAIYGERRTPVTDRDTFWSLYRRLATEGHELVSALVNDLRNGKEPELDEPTSGGETHPRFDGEDVADFYRSGHRFWSWADLFGWDSS